MKITQLIKIRKLKTIFFSEYISYLLSPYKSSLIKIHTVIFLTSRSVIVNILSTAKYISVVVKDVAKYLIQNEMYRYRSNQRRITSWNIFSIYMSKVTSCPMS